MNLKYTLTPEDYLQAQYLHLRGFPSRLFLPLVILGLMAAYWFTLGTIPPWLIGAAGGLVLFSIAFFTVILPLRCKRIFRQQKMLHSSFEAEITPDTYTARSERGTACIKWTDFHKYRVGKKAILVYQSDVVFHPFPTRIFSEAQLAEFKAILEKNLPRKTAS